MKLLVFFLLVLIAIMSQIIVNSAYYKYYNISTDTHYTGEMVARSIIDKLQLNEIDVKCIENPIITSFYNYKMKTIYLNKHVYYENSIYAIAIASYFVAYAHNYENGSIYIQLRNFIFVLLQNIVIIGWIFVVLGLLSQSSNMLNVGIILITIMGICSLLTYPIELQCTRKANQYIMENGFADEFEYEEIQNMTRALSIQNLGAIVSFISIVFRILFSAKDREGEI